MTLIVAGMDGIDDCWVMQWEEEWELEGELELEWEAAWGEVGGGELFENCSGGKLGRLLEANMGAETSSVLLNTSTAFAMLDLHKN